MRKLLAIGTLLGAMALSTTAQAQQSACAIFDDANFNGSGIALEDGRSFARLRDIGFNDRISSVQVRPGCQLRVSEDDDFGGRSQVIGQSVNYVGPDANDRISSVSCSCGTQQSYGSYANTSIAPQACAVYADENFGGESRALYAGELMRVLERWNDRVSSVRVAPGCALELAEDLNFGGRREAIQADLPALGSYWNDRASSLACQCGAANNGQYHSGGRYQDGGTYIGDSYGRNPNGYGTERAERREPLVRGGLACRIYNGNSFGGKAVTLRDGEKVERFGQRFEGKASSMQIAPGCAVVLDIGEPYKIWIDKDDVSFRGGLNNTALGAACYCPR